MVFFKSCFRGSRASSDRSHDNGWRLFSLKELQNASNNFNYDNKLGEGGFGSVYWGQLWDGSQIAVKRLKVWSSKPGEIDFAVEVEILGRVRHKNLHSLRGYCAEGKERLLVYNYMPNSSLSAHLHGHLSGESHLDWQRRMNIAIGCAEALSYLHHHATPHVVHGDLKSSNVLLSSDFEAHVSDFGFTRLVPKDVAGPKGSNITTAAGHLAPELASAPGLGVPMATTEKSDVYSFGILLLELVSGRRTVVDKHHHHVQRKQQQEQQQVEQQQEATHYVRGSGNKQTIVEWATPMIFDGRLDDVADPSLHGNFNEVELRQVVQVAQWCAQTIPENRPTMIKVVELLKKVREVEDGE